jgi:hypothetical protein
MAPQRRKMRAPKVIQLDRTIELRNRDLLAMNSGYKDRMKDEWKRIAVGKNTAQAKKNADYWLLGKGIGGVGNPIGRGGIKGPLADMWCGDSLYLMLTGKDRVTKGTKRESDEEAEPSTPDRRVRPRLDNDAPAFREGDDTIMQNYDELEVGREAQKALEDVSSAMPWNVSASIRGSSVARAAGSIAGLPGSAAGSRTRRGSRMISASPLIGRDVLSGAGDGLSSDPAPFNDYGDLPEEEDFELYGAAAAVDTQTAGNSQWQKAVLDRESNNFLDFISNAINDKRVTAQADVLDVDDITDIELEELLPVENNSRTVAAQALLHVLTLGTKHLIRATQDKPFSAITLQPL